MITMNDIQVIGWRKIRKQHKGTVYHCGGTGSDDVIQFFFRNFFLKFFFERFFSIFFCILLFLKRKSFKKKFFEKKNRNIFWMINRPFVFFPPSYDLCHFHHNPNFGSLVVPFRHEWSLVVFQDFITRNYHWEPYNFHLPNYPASYFNFVPCGPLLTLVVPCGISRTQRNHFV